MQGPSQHLTRTLKWPEVDKNLASAAPPSKATCQWALSRAFNDGVRMMNWAGFRVQGHDVGDEVVQVFGDSFRCKFERTRRTERVGGDGRRLAQPGQDRGDLNRRSSDLRLVNVERAASIASDEKYRILFG